MVEGEIAGSFRDPAGFVFRHEGLVLRQVNPTHREDYEQLMSSGLYDELAENSLLIPHEAVDPSTSPNNDAYAVVRPEQLDFVSYPYEWCFGQLKDAAVTTLEIQRRAMRYGMSLRDASAYNIQFHRGRALLIDTLSLGRLDEEKPWAAYRQFCEHFLAPLALMALRDVRLGQLLRNHLDGIPLTLASSLLPSTSKLRPGLAVHIHSHSRAQARQPEQPIRTRHFSRRSFDGLIDNLLDTTSGLDWQAGTTTWSDYYQEAESYTPEALENKKAIVSGFLDRVDPATAWDLGANVGEFSRIVSQRKIPTVSFDNDYSCVEKNYQLVKSNGEEYLLPLFCDLTNPSPSMGWELNERESLVQRGPAEVVIALALIHHLSIGNNVPLRRLANFLRSLGGWLIMEFVPKEDPRVKGLLASRPDIFEDYSRKGFETSFGGPFEIVETRSIDQSSRTLYLMRAR